MDAAQAIYVIDSETGHLKIGVSSAPWVRLGSLQSATPSRLRLAFAADVVGETKKLERTVHSHLGGTRVSGEWFSVSTLDAVTAIQKVAGNLGFQLEEHDLDALVTGRESKKEKSLPISFRLPVSKKRELDNYAAAHDRSLSWVIEKALTQYLQASGDLPSEANQGDHLPRS